MKYLVYYYKNGKIFSIDAIKNVRNKKEAFIKAREYAKSLGCEKCEVVSTK